MSSKGKFALLVGLLAGAATGVLFTPTNGKKFREQLKKDVKKGGYGKDSLWKHFEGMANEIRETANEAYDGSKLDKKVSKATKTVKSAQKKAKSNVSKAKTVAKKSKKIAQDAAEDIKDEINEKFGDKPKQKKKKK